MDARGRAAAAFIVIHHLICKRNKRKRRWWMKKLYLNRLQYGVRLLEDMRYEAVVDTIKNFTRESPTEFESLKLLIEPRVMKMNTQFREAISVTERLAITLRFLATGDSYTSLQYLFRVSKQSISRIVPEVCDALCDALKDWVKVSK